MSEKGTARADYPTLQAPGFGRVIVGEEEWSKDFFIRADGTIKPRKKKKVKKVYGSSHIIGPEELEKVCKRGPEMLVIAAGYGGVVRLAPEGEEYLAQQGIELEVLPTPQAVERYGRIDRRKAILVHVTC